MGSVARVSTEPLKAWSCEGMVRYTVSRDLGTATLYYIYKGNNSLMIYDRTQNLGIARRDPATNFWTAWHKRGYQVYFSNPAPIGYGVVTGELVQTG